MGRVLENVENGHSVIRKLVNKNSFVFSLQKVQHDKEVSKLLSLGMVNDRAASVQSRNVVEQRMDQEGTEVLDHEDSSPRDLWPQVFDEEFDFFRGNSVVKERLTVIQWLLFLGLVIVLGYSESGSRGSVLFSNLSHKGFDGCVEGQVGDGDRPQRLGTGFDFNRDHWCNWEFVEKESRNEKLLKGFVVKKRAYTEDHFLIGTTGRPRREVIKGYKWDICV